jgi:hypothetical protein
LIESGHYRTLEELAETNDVRESKERQAVIFEQLDKLTSRARILQRSMVSFYLCLGMFVATSVAIGVVAIINDSRYTIMPVILDWSLLPFLRQHASHLRSTFGAEYNPCGNGFYLAADDESGPGRVSGATQTAFCTFPKSQVESRD